MPWRLTTPACGVIIKYSIFLRKRRGIRRILTEIFMTNAQEAFGEIDALGTEYVDIWEEL
jgi:hypothetical protein